MHVENYNEEPADKGVQSRKKDVMLEVVLEGRDSAECTHEWSLLNVYRDLSGFNLQNK